MRSVRLADLRELLEGPAFGAWWTDWQRAADAAREARARREDLLSQSELMAHRAELARRAASAARARAREGEQDRPGAPRRRVPARERDGGGLERALLAAERGLAARRHGREAERRSGEAVERRARAGQLAREAEAAARELRDVEARQAALLSAAGERLGCLPGASFLYWRDADDERAAFAVALADDPQGDVPVSALGVYTVRPRRGAGFLEPAPRDLPLPPPRRAATTGSP